MKDICLSCINYEYLRKGEKCYKRDRESTKCINYRKWTKCISVPCSECRKCKDWDKKVE